MAEQHALAEGPGEAGTTTATPVTRARPARNASYIAASNLVAKLFSFVFVWYAFRALGPALFGNYTTVLAYVGLFGVLTDLGLGTLAVRDVAQNQSLANKYISNLVALRVVCSVVAVALIAALAQIYIAPWLRNSVYVYALALVPLAITNTLQLVFQFKERLSYNAVFNIATAALTAGLSIAALLLGHHVLGLLVVFSAVTLLSTIAMTWVVYTRFLPRRLEWDLGWWPVLLRNGLPFVLLTLLNVLYSRADMQLLYVFSHCSDSTGCVPVGQYGAAYRVLDILVMVFVGSVNAAVLPAFNRVAAESRQALLRLVRSSVTLMLALGVPVALLVSFYAPEALHVLAGRDFTVAAPALATLIWAFPCFLCLSMLYNALYALHKQAVVTGAFMVTLVFNVALNVLLLPRYSYFASSALTVASECVNGVIVLIALWRAVGPLGIGGAALRMAAVTVAAALALWVLRPYGGIFVGLPVGIVVILAGVRLLRVLGPVELEILGRMPLVGRYAHVLGG